MRMVLDFKPWGLAWRDCRSEAEIQPNFMGGLSAGDPETLNRVALGAQVAGHVLFLDQPYVEGWFRV